MQEVLLDLLRERGPDVFHGAVQEAWPIDAEAAFGAIPTPLRLRTDGRFTGKGTTIAFVDAGFHPHPDLTTPRNRIAAWADASGAWIRDRRFGPDDTPRWPGWEDEHAGTWHGLMTTTAAAGNGTLSHGFYRGVAPGARVVLVQVRGAGGSITSAAIARALAWIRTNTAELGVGVVSLSVGGEPAEPGARDPVEEEVEALVASGIVVVAAAGNDGIRRLVPPATAPSALTVGGLDDHNAFDHEAWTLWHANWGTTADGRPKPEIVAPSLWVVAPVLPGSGVAREAASLFAAADRDGARRRLESMKMVSPYYQHVEGTSFAAPLAAGVVATMLEANPELAPAEIREILIATAHPVPGAPVERQGAGALDAGRAVAQAILRKSTER